MIVILLFVSYLLFYFNANVTRAAAKAAEKEMHIPFQSCPRTNRYHGYFGGIMS